MNFTWSSLILWKPNFLVQMDSASPAAGSTSFSTFREDNNLSMQEKSAWK